MRTLSFLRRAAALASLCWLAACAAPFDPDASITADVPTRAAVQGVPLIEQASFYCGPASLAMVMQWAGRDVTQDEIAALSFTAGAGGTYTADMIGSARRMGQIAVELRTLDQLLGEVAAGHPVIVFQNLGVGIAPVWHYGVVTGYDLQTDTVSLNSGQQAQMVLPFGIFDRSWERGDRWALVILPPDQLPATVPEADVLSAAAGLERVGQLDAAETAYKTGAARWPENWLWQFGLGNTRYAMGDLRGARRALRRARNLAPDIPEIRANLAHVEREIAG
ncbi:PA2778 family cysteine peptidase [Loktanella agnita]|uniref:PA2778 family cysteine peptidase n=1 Tax=Loktanella agnita TaxID=287097 RepID=UPI003987215F